MESRRLNGIEPDSPRQQQMDVDETGDNRANEKVEAIEGENAKEEKTVEEQLSMLDLAFAMDCTGSMGSYIHQAQQNIRSICEEIVAKEQADIHLALVEYRDHPPQDRSFVTKVHNFTPAVGDMKTWLDQCSANGGGDGPEAVADALEEVRNLSWRPNATKICVFIADAPPHGLGGGGDGFPNGCPAGFDPMQVTQQIAELGVKIYMVGCEPSINPYKEFFMALCHLTGGQYVPLQSSRVLAKVIIGGAQEELSLQKMIEEVNQEVLAEAQSHQDELDVDLLTAKVQTRLKSKKMMSKQLQMNGCYLPKATAQAQKMADMSSMAEVRKNFAPSEAAYGGPPRARRAEKAMSAKKTKSSGGVTGWFGSFFGSSAAPETEEDLLCAPAPPSGGFGARMAPPPPSGGFGAPMAPPSGGLDDYGVEEAEVNMEQASRMVQQSIMTNNLYSRKKKL